MKFIINTIVNLSWSGVRLNFLIGGIKMLRNIYLFPGDIITKTRGLHTSILSKDNNKDNTTIIQIKDIVKGLDKNDPLRAQLKKGYKGYTNEFNLQNIILDDRESFIMAIKPFLASLDPNKVYHVLPVLTAEMVAEN